MKPTETIAAETDTPEAAPTMPSASQSESGQSATGLSDLGMAELVERFAQALEAKTKRDQEAAQQQAAPALAVADGANPFADRAAEAELGEGPMSTPLPFTSPLSGHGDIPVEPAAATASLTGNDTQPVTAEIAAEEQAPAEPMVFRPAASMTPVAEDEAVSPFGQPQDIPSALQPVEFDDDEDEDEGPHAPLTIEFASQRDFAPPTAKAPEMNVAHALEMPVQDDARPFAAPVVEAEESADDLEAVESEADEAYSSLLSMKSKLAGQEFARVDESTSDQGFVPEPVVVFPGQEASPMASAEQGSSTEQNAARPFDSPQASAPSHQAAQPLSAQQASADPSETERALREALEKLQRMSGAA